MNPLDPEHLPPVIAELVRSLPLAPLGPGQSVRTVKPRLEALSEASFAPQRIVDRPMAAACRAGLWLAYDFLDEAHAICQDLETAEGSFWHAILHRREPDAANSKYWWRRVGTHPVFEPLARAAAALGYGAGGAWDPFAFVDACERERGTGSAREELLRRVQQKEWELLFAWCHDRARG